MIDASKKLNINGLLDDLEYLKFQHSLIVIEINTYFSNSKDPYHTEFTKWNNYISSPQFLHRLKRATDENRIVVLDATMEGSIVNYSIKKYLNLLQSYNINFNKVFIAFNNSLLDPHKNTYYSGYNIRNIFFPHFFISTTYKYRFFDLENTKEGVYDFLCLNRRMRDGKLLILNELKKRNLLDSTLYTYVSDKLVTSNSDSITKTQLQGDLDYGEHIAKDDSNFLYGFNPSWYNKSKVEIVNETYYYEEDQCHMTEKIFKSILMEMPFVVNSTKGFLAELRKLGFKTFSSVIDESYDTADNDVRYSKVVDAAMELLKVHNTQSVKDICTYNKSILLSYDHKKNIVESIFLKKLEEQYEQLTPRRI